MPSLESEILATSPMGKMPCHLFKIVLALICILSFAEPGMSQSLQVVESTFCLDMDDRDPNKCAITADSKEISLSSIKDIEDGVPRLSFWTKLNEVREDDTISHVWIPSEPPILRALSSAEIRDDKTNPWLRNTCLATALFNLSLRHWKKLLPKRLSIPVDVALGICLWVKTYPNSLSFRTHSNIRAELGTYTVGVLDSYGNVIPGGGAKTIKIVP